ncbi:head-tail adaptor (plasmid) [Erwinia tracheiphila]|uniref:head-tail adaptor n=1 Tax=Erwinia tracheiphila TaxID=65700 RepID=UPI001F31D939|nr:head-tail adaptor [Erwinia tracheiphila]UIA94546.1 head-tail adaptor [Erwinia tracheiphila]
MARIDVTRVLRSPKFADNSLVVIRSTQMVGNDGRAVNTSEQLPFSGVVTSDQGDVLVRIATGERTTGSIVIHTQFRLFDGDTNHTADIVIWQGRKYTVASCNDYSTWGRGFVAAYCDLLPLSE